MSKKRRSKRIKQIFAKKKLSEADNSVSANSPEETDTDTTPKPADTNTTADNPDTAPDSTPEPEDTDTNTENPDTAPDDTPEPEDTDTIADNPDTAPEPLYQSHLPLDWTHYQGYKPINPLLDWAAPILALVPRLAEPVANHQFPELHEKLCEQIRYIENQMHQHSYTPQQTLAIRYVLSALIDELILHSPWGEHSRWKKYSLLDVFQRDRWQADEFFQILQHAAERPRENINFLEMCYLSLQLGFCGRYRQHNEQSDSLKTITKNLYQLIVQQRHPDHQADRHHTNKPFYHPTSFLRWPWLILILLLGFGAIKGYYALREHHLNTRLTHTLKQMGTNAQQPNNKKSTTE